jgi:hypothetical protein
MPRRSLKVSHPNDRRITRRGTAVLPDVPVFATDPGTPTVPEASADKSQSAAQPDSMDDRIRRMIEAAYT